MHRCKMPSFFSGDLVDVLHASSVICDAESIFRVGFHLMRKEKGGDACNCWCLFSMCNQMFMLFEEIL